MPVNFLGRRKLWSMQCESLFQIMASSLLPDDILTLCRKYTIAIPGPAHGDVALYQLAHQQCHHAVPFARQLQRSLDSKHALTIRRFATLSPADLRQTITTVLSADPAAEGLDIASVIWALASDPRPTVRPLEQRLIDELHLFSYGLLLAQWRQKRLATRQPAPPPAAELPSSPSHAYQTLEQTVLRLEQRETQLLQANACLQSQLQTLQRCHHPRLQALAPSPVPNHGQMARELRKLRYEVDKLQSLVATREAEIQTLQALGNAPPPPGLPTAVSPATPVAVLDPVTPLSVSPCLEGRTIAIIGGLDTGTVHYTQLIQELGGDCLHHDGYHNPKRLAEVIRQADIVLCPVDRNSHAATLLTKKICRAMKKSCYFLRSSGLSSMRSTLQSIAFAGLPYTRLVPSGIGHSVDAQPDPGQSAGLGVGQPTDADRRPRERQ